MSTESSSELRQRIRVMHIYALLAVLSLVTFGTLHIVVEGNQLVGYLELAGSLAVLLSVVGLRLSGNLAVARFYFLLTLIVLLVVMIATGGTEGTGIFWFFMFPVAAFFLAGAREGIGWTALLMATVFLLWAVAQVVNIPFYYEDITVRQLLVTLLVVGVGLFVYQRSREEWEQRARASQRELRAYLRQMTALHAKVDRAKSEFVTLASHQLRTPISAIGWSSEMLLSGDSGPLKKLQKEYIQGVYDSNRRLEAIVNAMLLVSSLELGALYVRPEPTDLIALSRKYFKEALKKVPDKALRVEEKYDSNLPNLKLDPQIIKQILQNLFSNAVKYTPPGGRVAVHIARSPEKLSPKSQGSITITVSDNGYGIPVSEQKNVFAKLFRAANIKTKDVDGTGLGLYIVKALLDQVGGRVQFVSEENKGSTFVVTLPLEGMTPRYPKQMDTEAVSKAEDDQHE